MIQLLTITLFLLSFALQASSNSPYIISITWSEGYNTKFSVYFLLSESDIGSKVHGAIQEKIVSGKDTSYLYVFKIPLSSKDLVYCCEQIEIFNKSKSIDSLLSSDDEQYYNEVFSQFLNSNGEPMYQSIFSKGFRFQHGKFEVKVVRAKMELCFCLHSFPEMGSPHTLRIMPKKVVRVYRLASSEKKLFKSNIDTLLSNRVVRQFLPD
jgi:hypothetical protein